MSEKSLEVDESKAAGWLTMPLVSSSLLELLSMALLPRLQHSGPSDLQHPHTADHSSVSGLQPCTAEQGICLCQEQDRSCEASKFAHPRGEGPDAQAPSADCSGADLMGEAAVCSTAAFRSAISSAVRESSASSNRLHG